MFLNLLTSGEGKTQTGVLTPMPCPHTLPMLLDMTGLALVPYRLFEEQGWAVNLDELHRALEAGRVHCEPKAIYISNPGKPTGEQPIVGTSCTAFDLFYIHVYIKRILVLFLKLYYAKRSTVLKPKS